MSTLIYPRSRGTVRLASSDPTAAPLIDMNYLAEAGDRQVLLEGVEMIREIMKSAAFGGKVTSELHPGAAIDAEAMKSEVLNRATTVYHGVGTCRMGVDDRAVVGPDLRCGHRGAPRRRRVDHAVDHRRQHQCAVDHDRRQGRRAGAGMSTQRPASLTPEFLDGLVQRVPGTTGNTWKLTEVYTGDLLVELPQSSPSDIAEAFDTSRAAQQVWGSWSLASGSGCSRSSMRWCSRTNS